MNNLDMRTSAAEGCLAGFREIGVLNRINGRDVPGSYGVIENSSPITAHILQEISEVAGLPAGVWNLVNGLGEDPGRALCEHRAIKAVAFVGESRTGSAIMRQGTA